ncbi:uncharacterized protein LOC133902917 [Phragmites australis]|uniref:uncharacterized protein LOC133902917 n=1 Tax=Phragmites australis TaxID=29695 RepID=UPI002D7A2DC0|nr:uncharacterized protein LOC133902917 [Phragmites australis]
MASSNKKSKHENKNQRELHAKALEGIVTANSFFTAAVFIGINGTMLPSPSIPQHCVPSADIIQSLFLFEVLSFSFYLVSSLIAQGMKLAIAGLEATDPEKKIKYEEERRRHLPYPPLTSEWDANVPRHLSYPPPTPAWDVSVPVMAWSAVGKEDGEKTKEEEEKLWWFRKMMKLSVVLSVLGSFFLMLAMVDVIQLKLGLLSCGGMAAVGAVLVLTLLGLIGLGVYVGSVVYSLRVY